MTDRGIRNNNPGNIVRDGTAWQGMAADQTGDARFVVFTSPVFGIRALARNLMNYQARDGCKTLRQIIGRYAPPSENNTAAYLAMIATAVGVTPDVEIVVDAVAVMTPLVNAIVAHECSGFAYPPAVVAEGIRAAGVADATPPPLRQQPVVQAQAGAAGALTLAGAVHYGGQAIQQAGAAAPVVKGWADQLSAFTSIPVAQHAVSALMTVAFGLTAVGIASSVLKHRSA